MSAEKNIEIFNSYESDWAQTRNRMIKWTNFYRGRQYSRKTSKSLTSMGMKPVVINVCRPLLSQQAAIITSTKPTWKVVPLQGADKELADMIQQFLVGKWNSDYVDLELDTVILDMLRAGAGYLFIDLATFTENATFDILIQRLNWKFVYPDPNASRYDLSDSEHMVIKKKIGVMYAQVKFRLTESEVKDAMGDVVASNPMSNQINLIDRFSKYPVERIQYSVKKNDDGTYPDLHDMPPTVFYTSRLRKKVEQEKRNWKKDLEALSSEGKIDLRKVKDLHIYRCMSLGQHTAYEGVINIRDYPIIPFINEMSEEVKQLDSETNFIEGIQENINKFYQLTLQNALLTGNVRFIAPAGAIKNKNQFQKTSSIPGSVNEWEPQPDLPNAGKPEMIQGAPLASAFYSLANDLKAKAEYELGMFGPMRGDASNSPETFSTTATLQNFGMERLKRVARKIDIMIAKAGEVMIQYMQNYTDTDEILSFIDDRAYVQAPPQPGQLPQPGNEQMMPNPTMGQVVEIGKVNQPGEHITDPKTEELISVFKNDMRIGKYALKVLTQPNLGTDRLIKAGFMSNMVMNKALPATPQVMKRIFDYLELPGYTDIVQELSEGKPNAQTIQKLIMQLRVLQKQNQMLQNESVKMAKQLEVSDFRGKLDKELQKIKDNIESTKGELVDNVLKNIDAGGTNGQES